MDFTRSKYRELLVSLQKNDYNFITFAEYCKGIRPKRFVILRHDVDLLPFHSLATAKIEQTLGIRAVYYFRAVSESWNVGVIQEISNYGHEVGYHYESLTTCQGDVEAAYNDFKQNLKALRELTPVQTICMHGSPRSPYDSKDIWKTYSYHDLEIIGEPYLDTDFSQMLYLTDTGRRWDGYKVSVRDKIEGFQEKWIEVGWSFHTTDDVIQAIEKKKLPNQLMITTHPQRWNDNLLRWGSELLLQNMKNVVKRSIISCSKK